MQLFARGTPKRVLTLHAPPRLSVFVTAAAFLTCVIADRAFSQCTVGWSSGDGDSPVECTIFCATAWSPAGGSPSRPVLAVAGVFRAGPAAFANRVAVWNGTAWQALGEDFDAAVRLLCVFRGEIIAAGEFLHSGATPLQGIARWDGLRWQALGSGVSGTIYDWTVYRGDLVVGGLFSVAGGGGGEALSRWDGEAWHRMISASAGRHVGRVLGATVVNDDLYIGGSFSFFADDGHVQNLARFNGDKWLHVGAGNVAQVEKLASFRGNLIGISSSFSGVGVPDRMAQWDGRSWTPLGAGFRGTPRSMFVLNDELIVSAQYPSSYYRGLAGWNGSTWREYCPGLSSFVSWMAPFGNELVAGGSFYWSGTAFQGGPVRWNGSGWEPFTPGINGDIEALAPVDGFLAFGGGFTQAGAALASAVTLWDGSTWKTYCPPPNAAANQNRWLSGHASAFTTLEGRLVAGGNFYMPGGQSCNVATLDGDRWSPIGGRFDRSIMALAAHDGEIIVGGNFESVDGEPVNTIARWDGNRWNTVGGLMPGQYAQATALASFRGDLYAGGDFVLPDGKPIDGLARWNGERWDTPGGGIPGYVTAILVDGDDLIVGGNFSTAGDIRANCIARWDGKQWVAYGNGTNGTVQAMTKYEGRLYIGGYFTFAGSQTARYIAMWDGSDWQPLGEGIGDYDQYGGGVYALAAFRGDLIVGGWFGTAGGIVSRHWARWGVTGPLPLISRQPAGQLARVGERVQLGVEADATAALGFQWRKNGTPVGDDVHLGGSTGNTLTIDPVGIGDQGAYDVVVSGACGSTTSERAPLRVLASVPGQPVLIPAQPASSD